MTAAEKQRARYADRKARRVCVICEAATDGRVRCFDCRLQHNIDKRKYQQRHPDRVAAARRRQYWRNPEKIREQRRASKLAKKLRGECYACSEPAADGSLHCAKHTEVHRAQSRDYETRKRNGKLRRHRKVGRKPVRASKDPIANLCLCGNACGPDSKLCDRCAHLDGVSRVERLADVVAALRGTDGLSLRELCEALGMNTDRNNGQRRMRYWTNTLMQQGRIRRYWREDSTATTQKSVSFRDGESEASHAVGCWAFALDGQTEREWARRAA